ncbi:hypothetical protein B0H13DRAFT_1872983 [Mycena leptocephala]|nr:hypothetical protein B0H13DRAFT_1872983 [Mycena leptocephala]
MPPHATLTQTRLNSVVTCLAVTANTLHILATNLKTPFLDAISNTTQSLLNLVETIKQNKNICTELLEQTYKLLNAVLMVHVKSDTGGELPPSVLSHIGKFMETLHKIHTFVEAQQNGSKLKKFFRQGEMSTLLKDCKAGLQQGFVIFQIDTANIMKDITEMKEDAENRHQAVLNMVEGLSDTTSSDGASLTSRIYSGSDRYDQQRFFVACDSAATQVELAALIGTHLGLKPGKDLTHPVIQHFSSGPQSLLILDNLETLWESTESRGNIEEFLSLLTSVDHLALMITMRGAERPAKVAWTRPFLQPLKPLEQNAARQTFIDIADNTHNPDEVDKILFVTDNMPLAINLLAHLVDSEGCSNVLSRWEEEKTSLISDGYDRRSNLDLSISLSLSSPRLNSYPHSEDLLSLLSMLPDGLTDVDLMQAKLPIDNILGCKAALIRTTLAYIDENKRLKALAPIREYMQKIKPPENHLVRPLLKHFQELLELFMEYRGTQSSSVTVARLLSNYSNMQNILWNGAQQGHPDLVNTIYCACDLNYFGQLIGWGPIPFTGQIPKILPQPCNHHLEAYYILSLFNSFHYSSISDTEILVFEALEHFKHFDDPDLKCRFYNALGYYYRIKLEITTAAKFSETALSIALSTSNIRAHLQGLINLAWIKWMNDDYSAAHVHAYEALRLARISADLHSEAQALRIECTYSDSLGDYKQSISLCSRARDLLALCGMSSGNLDHRLMNTQAEIHKLKSEYVAARRIHSGILQETSVDQDFHIYGFALLNIAEIDVSIGAPKNYVQSMCEKAREIFNTRNRATEVIMCDMILADLQLRERNFLAAKTLFERCIRSSLHPGIRSFCLERLGDANSWDAYDLGSTMVFLVHSVRRKEKLGIHKALQFLGDVFLAQDDEQTAISLFTVALEGFIWMDVHRSAAECMLQLGDISMKHGDFLKALKLWETARPLFERSSQMKQVGHIDERLAVVSEDVLEQYRNSSSHLEELNAVSSTVEEVEVHITDTEASDKEDESEDELAAV